MENKNKELFIDELFPAISRSLYETNNSILEDNKFIENIFNEKSKNELIIWKRPNEFSNIKLNLFQENIEPNDIKQGRLGNCWVLCAIASMAEFPKLIESLFISTNDQEDNGMYILRICKNGIWQNVVIDNYLPCSSDGGPVYARSNGPELWVMLLEKAYAKLHGSYHSLSMGWTYEAMMDFTGAPCKSYQFNSSEVSTLISNGLFFQQLKEMDESGYILSASTPGEDVFSTSEEKSESSIGLVPGHAYSLIAVKQLSNGTQLVCIRNPWGIVEWSGDWSDNSSLWTPSLKQELGEQFSTFGDDGLFWMSFQDLIKYFFCINICQVRLPTIHPKPWYEVRKKSYFVYDSFTKDISSFLFKGSVNEPTHAIFTIHQDDRRVIGTQPYLDIGIAILEINQVHEDNPKISSNQKWKTIASTGCSVERQISCEVNLEPNRFYLIVPCTTGGKFFQQQQSSEKKNARILNSEAEGTFTKLGSICFDEVFTRLNMDLDGALNRQEINRFIKTTQPQLNSNQRRSILKRVFYNHRKSEGLSQLEFKKALLSSNGFHMNSTWEERESKLLEDLVSMGYDENLNLIGSRGCVLSIHSEAPVDIHPIPFNPEIFEEALESAIFLSGKMKDYPNDKFKLFIKKNGYAGASILCQNDGADFLHFTMTITGVNVMSHVGSLTTTVKIPPKEAKIIHHIFPEIEPGKWSYKHNISVQRTKE